MSLELKNITKRFAGLQVLNGVSLSLAPGEFGAIVGPSGCGKSTALRMVAGLERADEGAVLWNGTPITAPAPERMLIFQEHALYPWRTVAENVGLGLEMQGMPAKQRQAQVTDMLNRVGLGEFGKYHPHQLSGGMRQRAAIARSLVMNPPLLLLDEPFGALDAMTRLTMQNELLQLWNGSGMTALLITHDIDEALYLADRIFVMSHRPGQIVREVKLTLPRPRRRSDPQFGKLKEEVLGALEIAV